MNLIVYIVILTTIALVSFQIIAMNSEQEDLHKNHFVILCKTGSVSYGFQILIIFLLWQTDELGLVSYLVMFAAFLCFIFLWSPATRIKWHPSSRDLTQATLWGQAVFVLVLYCIPQVNADLAKIF